MYNGMIKEERNNNTYKYIFYTKAHTHPSKNIIIHL